MVMKKDINLIDNLNKIYSKIGDIILIDLITEIIKLSSLNPNIDDLLKV